jgi:tetratricopeptide (TPR) repeat protein
MPKVSLSSKEAKPPEATASTAESGAGSFAPNTGPKNPAKIHLAYGQWQEQMGQPAEARQFYAKALAEDPKSVEALLGMARIDLAAGLTSEAEARLKKAAKLAPKDPQVLAAYGNYYAAQKDWKKALEKLRAASKLSPDDPNFQYLLAVATARSGDLEAAYPMFVRSVGEAPAHYNIGYICYENGKSADALEHLREALVLNPELAAAQTMLDKIENKPRGRGTSDGNDPTIMPASGMRGVPLKSKQTIVPISGNESSLPSSGKRWASDSITPSIAPSSPQMPAGLTPPQQEQWRNQQMR